MFLVRSKRHERRTETVTMAAKVIGGIVAFAVLLIGVGYLASQTTRYTVHVRQHAVVNCGLGCQTTAVIDDAGNAWGNPRKPGLAILMMDGETYCITADNDLSSEGAVERVVAGPC